MNRRGGIVALALIGAAVVAVLGLTMQATQESPPRIASNPKPQPAVPDPAVGLAGRKPPVRVGEPRTVAASGTGSLVVRVKAESGAAIPDARVVVLQEDGEHAAETNTEGVARLAGLSGYVETFVTAEGFAGDRASAVEVAEGEEASVSVVLSPGVPFDGVVVDGTDGSPIPDAEIVVGDDGGVDGGEVLGLRAPYDTTRSEAAGRFRVRGVTEGRKALLEARAAHHVVGYRRVQVLGGAVSPSPVVMRMWPAGRIVGVVRGPDGAGIEGATVCVLPEANRTDLVANLESFHSGGTLPYQFAYQAVSGQGGEYVVDGLPLDDGYVGVARAGDLAPSLVASGIRFPPRDREARADFVVRAFATLVVRLVDPAGRPVMDRGASVVMDDPSQLLASRNLALPDQGARNVYRLESLSPGEARVEVTCPSFLATSVHVHLEAGETSETVVRLDPGATVEGLVTDEGGRPLPGVRVRVDPVESAAERIAGGQESVSDSQGRFVVRGLEQQPSAVWASGIDSDARGVVVMLSSITVQPPATDVRLVAVRLGGATLRVMTPDGKPYAGAMAAVATPGSAGIACIGELGEGGIVRWSALREGEYEIRVRVAEHAPISRRITARLRIDLDLGEAVLERGLELRGRVVDSSGAPTCGASVADVSTDGKGDFVREHLARGPFRLWATAGQFLRHVEDVDVEPGMSPIVVVLTRGALVRLLLFGVDGRPAIRETLRADPLGVPEAHGTHLEPDRDVTDTRGSIHWRLGAGRWRISWQPDENHDVALGEWTFAEGETKDLELTLPKR